MLKAGDVDRPREPASQQRQGFIELAALFFDFVGAVAASHRRPVSQQKRACNRLDVDGGADAALRSVKFPTAIVFGHVRTRRAVTARLDPRGPVEHPQHHHQKRR